MNARTTQVMQIKDHGAFYPTRSGSSTPEFRRTRQPDSLDQLVPGRLGRQPALATAACAAANRAIGTR